MAKINRICICCNKEKHISEIALIDIEGDIKNLCHECLDSFNIHKQVTDTIKKARQQK